MKRLKIPTRMRHRDLVPRNIKFPKKSWERAKRSNIDVAELCRQALEQALMWMPERKRSG